MSGLCVANNVEKKKKEERKKKCKLRRVRPEKKNVAKSSFVAWCQVSTSILCDVLPDEMCPCFIRLRHVCWPTIVTAVVVVLHVSPSITLECLTFCRVKCTQSLCPQLPATRWLYPPRLCLKVAVKHAQLRFAWGSVFRNVDQGCCCCAVDTQGSSCLAAETSPI